MRGQTNTLAQVSIYDSVRRSLFKYNSAAGKRFYSFGGQRNTLAHASTDEVITNKIERLNTNSTSVIRYHLCINVCTCLIETVI